MKNKVFVFLVIIIVLAVTTSGCRKDKKETFRLEGIITNKSDGNGIEGAAVTFSSSRIQTGVYNSNYEDLVTVYTDANGNFSTDITEEKTAGYRIYINKNKYFDYLEDISAESFISGETYNLNYSIAPIGYVKIRAINKFPYDNNDFISYRYTSGYLTCASCCNNTSIKGYGTTYDSTFVCKAEGGTNLTVTWNVIKNGQSSYNSSVISCPSFDTVYFEINY